MNSVSASSRRGSFLEEAWAILRPVVSSVLFLLATSYLYVLPPLLGLLPPQKERENATPLAMASNLEDFGERVPSPTCIGAGQSFWQFPTSDDAADSAPNSSPLMK